MKEKQLLALGFEDTSSPDDIIFHNYLFRHDEFKIEVYGNSNVDIYVEGNWITVPNCKTIADIKHLIRLFSCNP